MSLSRAARGFWRDTASVLLALSLLNGSNFLFHVAVSRLLGPGEWGGLAALLAVILVLSVPFGVVQTVVAKRTAQLRAEARGSEEEALGATTLKALTPVAVVGLVVMAAVSPALASLLRVGPPAALLLGPYVLLSLLAAVPMGVLQGRLRFQALAGVVVASVGVRLAAGITLVWVGLGISGALLGTVLAQAVALGLAVRLLGFPTGWWATTRATLASLRGEVRVAAVGLVAFWLLAEADVALARRYLDPTAAGLYSSAGLIARALLFLPAAVSIVALPRFAETHGRGAEARRWLRLTLGAVVALEVLALPVLVAAREPAVALTFGGRFREAAALVPTLAVAMGFLAVVNLLVYFHITAGSHAHRLVLGAVAAEAGLVALLRPSPEQLALMVVGVGGATAAVLSHAAAAISRWSPRANGATGEVGERAAHGLLAAAPEVELSVILPCYKAGPGLGDVLTGIRTELAAVSHEVIVVSDGSTDETVRIAEGFAGDGVRVLHYPHREGKGHALRVGLAEARGRYVGFIDADGDIDPTGIRPFVELMRLYEPDVVLGSKRHPLSEVAYPPARRILSWAYHRLVRSLFRVNVRDTQTGLKLLRREVLAAVLPRMLEKRYAFDLELLVVARRLGYRRVFEAPVRIDYGFSSQMSLRAALRIVLDTLAVFYRRYVLNTYQRDGAPPRPLSHPSDAPRPSLAVGDAGLPSVRNGRLRILFLNWRDVRNPDSGGAEVFTHEVARRWAGAGHEVWLLTSRFPGGRSAETVDGVRIRRVGRLRTGSFHLLVQRELARLQGFDLVIDEINTVPFFTPLWRRRLPPVITLIHQLAADVWHAELLAPVAVGRWLEPRLLRLYADLPVVTVSESTRADLIGLGFRDVSVVPDGRDDPPPLDGIAKEAVPTFLFVGRLTANKRPDHAVEAFRLIRERMPEARLWIVGRGPLEERLRRTLPEGAELLGYLPREELYRRMSRAHCLLVTSVREGWGLVVIEANSVGTPAVAYNVPGIRDSVQDRWTGLLVRPGDPASLAAHALWLLADPARHRAMRERAALWSLRFSWDATAEAFMALIRDRMPASAVPLTEEFIVVQAASIG